MEKKGDCIGSRALEINSTISESIQRIENH